MRRIATFAAVLVISVIGFAPSASADVCYEIDINANGTPVQQSGCIPL